MFERNFTVARESDAEIMRKEHSDVELKEKHRGSADNLEII